MWVRLDDRFHSHPKVLAAGNAAAGLYARSLAYSGEYRTDGFIPDAFLTRDDELELAERLVNVRLWKRQRHGYVIPDWTDYNPTRRELEERSDRARAASRARWNGEEDR